MQKQQIPGHYDPVSDYAGLVPTIGKQGADRVEECSPSYVAALQRVATNDAGLVPTIGKQGADVGGYR